MRGPCAKRRVVCVIEQGAQHFRGENDCENPQPTCPRTPGEGYEKCQTICQQGEHAEVKALKAAGDRAQDAIARIWGHYYICEPCGRALQAAGIHSITLYLEAP